MVQFIRETVVRVAGLTLKTPDLYIEFGVPFDNDPEPNEATVIIYNLTFDTINRIKKDDLLTVEAGYRGDTGIILSGRVSGIETRFEGAERVTTVHVLDGPSFSESQKVSKAYKQGIKASAILRDLVAALNMGEAVLQLPEDKTYAGGYTVNDKTVDAIKNIAADLGISFYISKGKPYIRSIHEADDIRFTLSPETGMIGSPEPIDNNGQKGYRVRCLLQHRIDTASRIQINSIYVSGKFNVIRGEHTNNGDDFITELEVV